MYHTRYVESARALIREHGATSEAVAAERAEEQITNINVGGFAFWKRVERSIPTAAF